MLDALNTKRTLRGRIVAILTGAGSVRRDGAVVAGVAALVSSGGLAACDGSTFGVYNSPHGSNDCSIALGSNILNSASDLPWSANDVGKAISVQGAGAGGASLESLIIGYTNPGQITIGAVAATAVVSSATSVAGIAIWGDSVTSEVTTGLVSSSGKPLISLAPNIIDLRAFHVAGDGTTDDTVNLMAAIRSVPDGGTLYVPAGIYKTTGLVIDREISIVGDGIGSEFIIDGNTGVCFTVNADNVRIENIKISGSKLNEAVGPQYGIVANGDNGTVRNTVFGGYDATHGLNVQIDLNVVSNWLVDSCVFELCFGTNSGNGYGCLVETCTNCKIHACRSTQSAVEGRHHVYISAGCVGCVVDSCIFDGGTSSQLVIYALHSQAWNEYNTVSNNIFSNCGDAAAAGAAVQLTRKVRHNLVSGNQIYSALTNGVVIQGGTDVADSRAPNNFVDGNNIYNNGTRGIYLFGCDECVVSNNVVAENSAASAGTYCGVAVEPNSANNPTQKNVLIGNVFKGTTNQRAPWVVGMSLGVRPAHTVFRGNESPKGNFKYAQDDGLLTCFDESYTVKKTISYADFATGGLTNFVSVLTLGPGEKIESVTIKHDSSFAGGAIGTYTVSVGIFGNYTKYAGAFDVFQAPGAGVFRDSNLPGLENMATGETDIRALATSTGANLSAATAGSLDVWVTVKRSAMRAQ